MEGLDWVNPTEIGEVRLARKSDAAWWTFPWNRNAITFDELVILYDTIYDYIRDTCPPSWYEVQSNYFSLPIEFRSILELLIHELTHVRQYFDMGPSAFYASYLGNKGPLEDEAVYVTNTFLQRVRSRVCPP
jgi:hypothetical protein